MNSAAVTQDNTLIITENADFATQAEQVSYLKVVTPQTILHLLGQRGIQAVLVEGGSELHAAFVQAHAYQEIIVYQTTGLLPNTGVSSFGTADSMTDLGKIKNVKVIDNTLKVTIKREEA